MDPSAGGPSGGQPSDADAPPRRRKARIKASPTLVTEVDDESNGRDTAGSTQPTDGKRRRRRSSEESGVRGYAPPAGARDAPPCPPGVPNSTPKAVQQHPTSLSTEQVQVPVALLNDWVTMVNDVAEPSSASPNLRAPRPEQCASRAMCAKMAAQALSSERGDRTTGHSTEQPAVLSRANSRGSRGSGLAIKVNI